MGLGKKLYGSEEIKPLIESIADKIANDFLLKKNRKEFVLVGIFKEGVPLAQRIKKIINDKYDFNPEIAFLDVSMYRDDFGMGSALPIIKETIIPFDMNDANVILVDDVLSSGRTIRAALDAVTDYGRPKVIRLAVLVDRGNSEYPIHADYVGMDMKVAKKNKIVVSFQDDDNESSISVIEWDK